MPNLKVLAIEAACPPGSVALVLEKQVVGFRNLGNVQRTTQTFAVMIQSLLDEASWAPREIDAVVTSIGPGSFTGLRIGVTAAKVFAYAVGARAIGVNTLEIIAQQSTASGEIDAVLDAQRGELFAARFQKQGNIVREVKPTQIMSADDWLSNRASSSAILIGPGLQKLETRLLSSANVADPSNWRPRADSLGAMAVDKLADNIEADPWKLVPQYYRRSAAEEKADKR